MTSYYKHFFILLFCAFTFPGFGQQQVYPHRIYNSEIKSVLFYANGQPQSMPFIDMGGSITLEFDDLGEYIRNLNYAIIHCNRDWTSSDINISQYLDGYDDAELNDFTSSRGTLIDYMHYRLDLPNNQMRWKISGNYILKVWDRDNNDEVLMTLRFVVYETNIRSTRFDVIRSIRQGNYDSHQDISFAIGIKDIGLDDPMRSVSASVIQNYDWNSIQDSIRPRRLFLDELFFDQHNSVVFPAMREYRLLDLRSMFSRGFGIHDIAKYQDGINVTLHTDELRGHELKFGDDRDINGAFVIDNQDRLNNDWEVEYVYALFSLHYFNAPPDAKVYVLGAFNNFTADENSLMEFDEENSIFFKEILLKQGVYDYVYGVQEPGKPLTYEVTEGYDNRASNVYHALIYYRPFLGNYDRVIAYN
jgi:hypothetical protein